MTTLVITHAVAEYDAWKQVFDEHAASRREHGCLSEEPFRSPDAAGTIMNVMRYPNRRVTAGGHEPCGRRGRSSHRVVGHRPDRHVLTPEPRENPEDEAMFAVVTMFEGESPQDLQAGMSHVEEEVLPALRDATGLTGCWLVDREPGRRLSLMVWDSKEEYEAAMAAIGAVRTRDPAR